MLILQEVTQSWLRKKKFLTTLFRKVKFGLRNKLLAISERMFQNIFIEA